MNFSAELKTQMAPMLESNPELSMWVNFAADETVETTPQLSEDDRWLAIYAVLLGSGGADLFQEMLEAGYRAGFSPVKTREVLYQSIAYLGMSRVYPFVEVFSAFVDDHDIQFENGTQVKDRLIDGNSKQIELFGPQMEKSWEKAPADRVLMNKFLADNCFGDYYTRKGLDNRERELVTFCYNYAQGGADAQATAHARANFAAGNSAEYLVAVIDACVPYLGYPRSLNGLTCVENAQK